MIDRGITSYDDIGGSPLRQSSPSKVLFRYSSSPPDTEYFSRSQQQELTNILKDIIYLERDLESTKKELSLKPDFNLRDAFRMLDRDNRC